MADNSMLNLTHFTKTQKGNFMQLAAEIVKKLKASFEAQSMMQTMGAEISHLDVGAVTLSSPIPDTCKQQHGFGHAALTFGLGDSAAGYAALSVMPAEAEVLTSEIKINLLAPCLGDHIEARGRVIKPGRRLVIVQSDVYAITGDQETHIALLTGTMVPILPK